MYICSPNATDSAITFDTFGGELGLGSPVGANIADRKSRHDICERNEKSKELQARKRSVLYTFTVGAEYIGLTHSATIIHGVASY